MGGGPVAEVHILVIEKERFIQTAELLEAGAPYQQAPAGGPLHGTPRAGWIRTALAAGAGKE
jgi:hypothetical protein